MDANAIQQLLSAGPWGIATLLLLAVLFLVRHIIGLYERIDTLHGDWRKESTASAASVTTALNTLQSAITLISNQHKG